MAILDDVLTQCTEVNALAQGGQKTVVAAQHAAFGSVVIKYGEYRHATTLERITREVQLLRELESRYYPRLYEFLIEPIQREFLVIEERLDAVELSRATNRFGTDDAIKSLLFHLLCALDVIWRRNVVHRDIKPANILITAENEPRIIDLGIARFLDDIALTDSLAAMGPGTLIYAAPEQLRNRRSMINVRTDFYLLGLLILELMHGFHPFDPRHVGTPDSLLDNVFAGRYVAPDEQRDEVLRQFVSTALAVQPYLRFRTVEAVFDHFGLDRDQC